MFVTYRGNEELNAMIWFLESCIQIECTRRIQAGVSAGDVEYARGVLQMFQD
jgi:hypothetical protein